MSGDLGSLVISLTAETAQFKDALTKSAYQMDQSVGQMVSATSDLQKSFGKVDAQLAAFGINLRALFGLAAAGGLAHLVNSAIESADRIHDLSEQTGIAAGELAAMRSAAAQGGISLEEVAKASTKFSKAIETQNEDSGKAAKALTAMGLSMEELKTHSPAEQLHIVAERLNTFADGSGKAAAAQELFGKSGVEILPFLKTYGDQVELTKAGYGEFSDNADRFGDSLARLKLASQEVAEGYAQKLLPSLIAVAEAFEGLTATKSDTFGFMDLLGEAVRVLALGFVTLWTAAKNLFTDLVTGAKVAYYSVTMNFSAMADAMADGQKKIEANNTALLAFSDKVLAGSKVFGDAAAATEKMGTAAETTKPKLTNISGEMGKAAEEGKKWLKSLQDQIAKLGLTEEAVMRLQAREKGLGDTADGLIKKFVETKTALEAQKKATEAAEAALKKQIDAQVEFRDKLVENIGTLGLSEEATLKLRARQLDLGDSTDDLIAQYITAKAALAQYTKAVEDAKREHDAYVGAVEATVDRTANAVLAWRTGNQALQDQIYTIGLTKTEIERLAAMHVYEADVQKAQLIEDRTTRESFLEYLRDEYQKRLALINSAEMKQAYIDSAAAAQKAYEDSARAINKSLVDAIMGGFSAGKSLAEQFKNTLIDMFKNLVLRPILQPVSNYMAGLFQQGQTALGGFFGAGTGLIGGLAGGGDYAPGENPTSFTGTMGAGMGGWGGILAGAALGGAIGSQYGSKNPIYGSIAGAGAMVGMAGATGVLATGAAAVATAAGATVASAAAVAAAVPVIGWIVAAIALIASFAVKPGGGPKVGSFQSANYEDGMVTGRSGWNSSGGGDNQAMNATIDAFNASYIGYVKALGGTLIDKYSVHSLYETDPQGTASSYGMFIMAKPGQGVPGNGPGQSNVDTIGAYYNSGKFDPTAANFELYASRALLAAVQQSQLPADVAQLLNSLIPNALSSAQISNVLAYASAFHALPQVMKDALDGITGLAINPETSINLAKFGAAYAAVQKIIDADLGADVATMLEQANQTQIEKFRAQGVALSEMAAQFDGSADAALNLAQATAQYYQNQIQLLAALEQASSQFHKSIQDAQRSISLDILDKPGQMDFYRKEFEQQQQLLEQAAANPATADPADVSAQGELARKDLMAWWGMLDDSQKAAQYDWFSTQLDALDAQVTAANKAIADNIKAQNDPNNPASPIGQVKGAFDKFLLDMGQWLEDNRAVATDTSTAANVMAAAADKMDAAGDGMLAAANTPARIDLTWNGSEVTAGSA